MSKAMIVYGSDKQVLPYGRAVTTEAFNIGTRELERIYGKTNVLPLLQPKWESLLSMLQRHQNELETFVFVGHGEKNEGIVINDSPLQSVVKPGWLSHHVHLDVWNVYLYACYQGVTPLRESWITNFGFPPNFHAYDGSKLALILDVEYLVFFDRIVHPRH